MLTTALAQLRVAAAAIRGRPAPLGALDRLTTAALATRREFGTLGPDGAEAVAGPPLDPATLRDVQLRRFRTQAKRAARDTAYYAARFADLGLDPATLDWDAIARLPLTPKTALRDDPDAFVRRGTVPVLRATTHGTTGFPTAVCFSAHELRLIAAHAGLGFAVSGALDASDVVQIHTSARGLLGNWSLTSGAARVGALVQPVGTVEPALALSLLSRELKIPGKKPKVSAISTYPSYLGALVEAAPALGYTPADFALHRIMVGGEIVTRGLRDRARRLFGDVALDEGWAMSETFPCGGTRCEAGHLHTDPSHALVEVLDPVTHEPTPPGAAGTLVVTPFPALRETTLLLRYDVRGRRPHPGGTPHLLPSHPPRHLRPPRQTPPRRPPRRRHHLPPRRPRSPRSGRGRAPPRPLRLLGRPRRGGHRSRRARGRSRHPPRRHPEPGDARRPAPRPPPRHRSPPP